jgi:excisionase family DNA binding protein
MTWERQTLRATEIRALLAKLGELLAEEPGDQPEIPAQRTAPERTLLNVEEAAERLGISRTRTYALIGSGELVSVRIGRLRRVPITAIADYAARLVANEANTIDTQEKQDAA